MSLPIFALFSRTLRTESRLLRTYLVRGGLLGLTFFAVLSAHVATGWSSAPGLTLLVTAVVLNFLFITGVGITTLAAVITEEKEEGVLDLLRMAGLDPVAVLLGKSTSRLIGVVMLVVVQFPFALLAATLGGASVGQIAAVYVALLAYMVFLSNLALFCSLVASSGLRASVYTALVLGGFLVASYAAAEALAAAPAGGAAGAGGSSLATSLLRGLRDANPYRRLTEVLSAGFAEGVLSFQVVSNLALGLFFFLLSWAGFGLCTGRRASATAEGAARPRRRSLWQRWFPRGRPHKWAVAWKDFHFLTGGRGAIAARFVVLIVLTLIGLHAASDRYLDEALPRMMMAFATALAGVELIIHAARMFREEITANALPLLFILPVRPRQLLAQKIAGVLLALAIPYGTWFVLAALVNPAVCLEDLGRPHLVANPAFLFLHCLMIAILVAYRSVTGNTLAAIGFFALWFFGNSAVVAFCAGLDVLGPFVYFIGPALHTAVYIACLGHDIVIRVDHHARLKL